MKLLTWAITCGIFLTGCASETMYDGPRLDKSEVALLFLMETAYRYYTSVDGEPVDFMYDGKVLEFLPGKHTFEIVLNNYYEWDAGYYRNYSKSMTQNLY